MRLLLWSEQYWPFLGGLEVLTTRLAEALVERGHDVHVVTCQGSVACPGQETRRGVRIHRLDLHEAIARRDPAALLAVRTAARRIVGTVEPELVHVAMIAPSVALLLDALDREPLVVTQQMFLPPALPLGPETLAGRILRRADAVTACSNALAEDLARRVPAIADRTTAVRNGVVTGAHPAIDPPAAPALLCIGRLVPEKGFDLAVAAMPAILERHRGARLAIVGDGPARADLERAAETRGAADAITFHGWQAPEALAPYIDDCALLLAPSRTEALGLAVLEAAARGRAAVAAAVGGLPEAVDDGCTGRLVPPEDAGTLAGAVADLLDDPARIRRLGAAARERVKRGFRWGAFVDAFESIYDGAARVGRERAA